MLLPAIDLVRGRVVRLLEGDFERETVYGDDPAASARAFVAAGARWIHVVDLDGARAGRPVQVAEVAAIIAEAGASCRIEVAGGIRDASAAARALDTGAARVVVGTAALRDPAFVTGIAQEHGADRVAVALDVRGGRVVGEAWRAGAEGEPVEDALRRLADAGAVTFEVTAIDRDGTLEGPDLRLLERLVRLDRGSIIASAGIGSLVDILAVRDIGCAGAIVGRALYEGRFDLAQALAAVAGASGS